MLEPDNECDQWRAAGLPLFVTYASLSETQEEYATSFLAAHRDTWLVTITIGGDDLLVLEGTTCEDLSSTCVANYIFNTFTPNLRDIYMAIRSTGYDGPIVAVNYASPDYTNTGETDAVSALNSAILSVTESFREKLPTCFLLLSLRAVQKGFPAPLVCPLLPHPRAPAATCIQRL